MRIVMKMHWPGVTPDMYEQVRNIVKWETDIAEGGVFHVSSFDQKGLYVTDIWESAENMNNFVQNRIVPAAMKVGVTSQPQVEVTPVHAIFAPGLVRLK